LPTDLFKLNYFGLHNQNDHILNQNVSKKYITAFNLLTLQKVHYQQSELHKRWGK